MNISSRKQSIFISILVAALAMGVLYLANKLVGKVVDVEFSATALYFLPLAFILVVFLATKKLHYLKGESHLLSGLLRYGFYLIIAGLIFASISLVFSSKTIIPTFKTVGFLALSCLATATFEELLCRGFIQNLIVETDKSKPLSGVVIASGIFALLHLLNLIQFPQLVVATISQVFYTFALGFMLGVSYYRSNSLLAVIILHAYFNFTGNIAILFNKVIYVVPVDIPLFVVGIQLVIMLPGILISYKLFKQK